MLTGKITREGVDITQTAIFMNSGVTIPATNALGSANNGLTKESRREFVETTGDYKIQDIAGLVSTGGVFADVDEDGRIDVLL